MQIEAGSQNVSRTPGLYAYPQHNYNNNAIHPISAVEGHKIPTALREKISQSFQGYSPDKLELSDELRDHLKTRKTVTAQKASQSGKLDISESQSNSYMQQLYNSGSLYKGLYLDISA